MSAYPSPRSGARKVNSEGIYFFYRWILLYFQGAYDILVRGDRFVDGNEAC